MSTYRVTCIGDLEGDMDSDRVDDVVGAHSEAEAKRVALQQVRKANPNTKGWYVDHIERVHESSASTVWPEKVRASGQSGPHVYKHGRP